MLQDGWVEPTVITPAAVRDISSPYIKGIDDLNEPFSLNGFAAFLVYDKARENGCRAVFDGMAGDLLFYDPWETLNLILGRKMLLKIPALLAAYRRHEIDDGIRMLVKKSATALASEKFRDFYKKLKKKLAKEDSKSNAVEGDLSELLDQEIGERYREMRMRCRQQKKHHAKQLSDQCYHSQNFTTGCLSFAHEINGQLALSTGVEPRSPFSDRRMIEFAVRMPVEAKISVPFHKNLLRISMDGILPDPVRWRKELWGHPGWQFYERLVSDSAGTETHVWSRASIENVVGRWIDKVKVNQAWHEYERTRDHITGYNLFTLVVLAQWMKARQQLLTIQSSGTHRMRPL